MKLAHFILAHNAPRQLERLVTRLMHPEADIYIHLDKKTDIAPFEYLRSYDNVFFIKNRVKVYWGTHHIIRATINSFKEIVETGKSYGHVNLLSGQDYPLKSNNYICEYLNKNPDTAFMSYLRIDTEWVEALPRIEEYHFNSFRFPDRYVFQKFINKILPKRSLPNGLIPVGRSQWFTIPLACVACIIKYWEANPSLRHYVKFTWAPDEFIFQTILYNSEFKSRMINNDLRYIDWSGGGVSPKTLGMADADDIAASDKLFARKFDMIKDAEILDFIDSNLVKEKQR